MMTAPTTPLPATGNVIPMNEHGAVRYITPGEKNALHFYMVAIVLVLLGSALNHWRERQFRILSKTKP